MGKGYKKQTSPRKEKKHQRDASHQIVCNLASDHTGGEPVAQPGLVQSSSLHISVRRACWSSLSVEDIPLIKDS
jgi:hypothetical protein|tara:strand:+ start:811 stop:1032 length:222 start_codon:yes stop_codon:yes gene_type:complete